MVRDYVMCVLGGICATSMMFTLITNSVSKRRRYTLFNMSLIAILLLIADKVSNVCDGKVDGFMFGKICKFMVYALFLLIIFVFNVYLKDLFLHEGHEKHIPNRLKYVDFTVITGEVVFILAKFMNFYYYYEDNVYQIAKGFCVSYIFPLVALGIQLSVILQHRAKFRKRLLFPLVFFTMAPGGTALIQFYVRGESWINCTIVLMVVLLFAFSIMDTNRLIEKAHKNEIQMLLERENNIKAMVEEITDTLVEAIDAKDTYTKGHSKRVAKYSKKIAEKAGKSKNELEEIYFIALLHDVGKIGIPDSIINKTGTLTVEEEELVKTHPIIGKDILEKIKSSPNLVIGALFHHERYDGKGYPSGLSGEEIPEIARIIAVADTYDAMSSKRSYRDILPQNVIREEISKGVGTQFDPFYAKIMLELIDEDKEYHMRQF